MCPVSSLVQEPPEYHVLNVGSAEVYCSPGHAIADTSNDLIGYLIDGGVGTVSCRFIEASGHWNSTGIRRLRVGKRPPRAVVAVVGLEPPPSPSS